MVEEKDMPGYLEPMPHVGRTITAKKFDDLYINAVSDILNYGVWTEPRGFKCKELLSTQLILTDAKNCLPTMKDRKLNYAYLTIEKFMYLSQFQDPEILIAYNKNMQNYLNEKTGRFDGAYGERIAKGNQLEWCYQELKKDPDSRRAVVTIHDHTDCDHDTKDAACTLSLQFLIRDGKLDIVVNMRSNDILWGLCLDIPAFCFIQEVMAKWLEIPVGKYMHHAASLHYYDTTEKQALAPLAGSMEVNGRTLPKWDIPFDKTKDALMEFWTEEKRIRDEGDFMITNFNTINQYLFELKEYWDKKKNGENKDRSQ